MLLNKTSVFPSYVSSGKKSGSRDKVISFTHIHVTLAMWPKMNFKQLHMQQIMQIAHLTVRQWHILLTETCYGSTQKRRPTHLDLLKTVCTPTGTYNCLHS